jgi:hypothetical protein
VNNKPLAYERQVMRKEDVGLMILLWRRQAHKTTTLARKALKYMMKRKGCLVTFVSASLLVGSEMIRKEEAVVESTRERFVKDAELIKAELDSWKGDALKAGMKAESNADGLTFDDFCDLFEAGRLEAKLWHSKTVCSRTLIVAPNIATARGFSGFVFWDEIGFIIKFHELFEAMEPIMSSDPSFRGIMATTFSKDDAHYSNELIAPPEEMKFEPNPEGHWYRSQAGILVHRVDAYDAAAAGLKTYDLDTRAEITPAEHRAQALDRNAWDRNYGLIRTIGGTAAVPITLMNHAQAQGRDQCIFAEDELPPNWLNYFRNGTTGLGLDIATTEDKQSNPSCLVAGEKMGPFIWARLIVVFKTNDPNFTRAMLEEVIAALTATQRKPRRLSVDASNERFFATDLRRELMSKVITELVVGGETHLYRGEKMNKKTYMGNQLLNFMEDGFLGLPESRYVKEDFRLVTRDRGNFLTKTDSMGRHGDAFDGVKHLIHALVSRGGPAKADAAGVGSGVMGNAAAQGNWKNPYRAVYEGGGYKSNA